MYEITIGDEFARWFEVLEPNAAEQVAGALEVVAATGPVFDPVKQSQWLLWFDDAGSASPSGELAGQHPAPGYVDLLELHHEVVRFLDGPTFKRALARLDDSTAAQAVEGVRRLRQKLRAAWLSLASDARRGAPSYTRRPAGESRGNEAASSIESALEAVLTLVGLGLGDLGARESGLRELTLLEAAPPLRVIYGLDVAGQRLVALIGEALTRRYYGDTVRLAEQRWGEYLLRGQVEGRLRARPHAR